MVACFSATCAATDAKPASSASAYFAAESGSPNQNWRRRADAHHGDVPMDQLITKASNLDCGIGGHHGRYRGRTGRMVGERR
jgi:hypothetical protein